jgi:hypothetical protein
VYGSELVAGVLVGNKPDRQWKQVLLCGSEGTAGDEENIKVPLTTAPCAHSTRLTPLRSLRHRMVIQTEI